MPSTDYSRRYSRGPQHVTVVSPVNSSGGSSPSPPPAQQTTIRGQLKKLYHRRNPGHARFDGGVRGEEYLTKRRVETKTTRNTEKRIQRQVVLDDGRVIQHDDPEIVVDTVEDTQTREEEHVDNRDNLNALIRPHRQQQQQQQQHQSRHYQQQQQQQQQHLNSDRRSRHHHYGSSSNNKNISSSSRDYRNDIIDDTFRRTVNTHDVKEDVKTTAVSQHLGKVSRRALDRAIRDKRPISELIVRDRFDLSKQVATKPKVIYEKKSRKKVVDTEDVHNISRKTGDGKVVTETFRTQEHEVFDDSQLPDSDPEGISYDGGEKVVKDNQKYSHRKKDEFTDYYRVPKDGRGEAEHLGRGPQLTTEEKAIERGDHDWEDLDARIRQNRERIRQRLHAGESADRKDALTKKPLNYNHEEKTRKVETDKWLERHFGSDWSLTTGSSSFNNRHLRHHFDAVNKVHGGGGHVKRSTSFSSIPITYTNPGETTTTTTKKKVIKTKTTTFNPGAGKGGKVVRTSVEEHRDGRPSTANKYRKYNSTLCLATPKADYALHPDPLNDTRSRSSRMSNNINNNRRGGGDEFTATQSLGRAKSQGHGEQHQNHMFGDGNLHSYYNLNRRTASSSHHRGHTNHHHYSHHEERYNSQGESGSSGSKTKKHSSRRHRDESSPHRIVFRSESRNAGRTPLYITEFRREKLYPATSENNILSFSSTQRAYEEDEVLEKGSKKGGGGFSSSFRPHHFSRDYSGLRQHERTDAASVDSYRHHSSSAGEESTAKKSSNSSGVNRRKARSQSFLVKSTRPREHYASFYTNLLRGGGNNGLTYANEDDYVYDRFERRFVPVEGGLRHGHSDLRLDRGHGGIRTLPAGGHRKADRGRFGGSLHHLHTREFRREEGEAGEPQMFKTIIFLSGN